MVSGEGTKTSGFQKIGLDIDRFLQFCWGGMMGRDVNIIFAQQNKIWTLNVHVRMNTMKHLQV